MAFKLTDVTTVYTEDPKLNKEDVETVLGWVKTQPHLPELTELQAILFLHSCYYQLELTKTTIENYFTLKSNSDLFRNVTQEVVRKVLTSFFIGFLPKKTPEGNAVLLMKVMDTRPEAYNSTEHTKVIMLVISLYYHQYGPAEGLVAVFDMAGSCFGHLIRMNPMVIKQFCNFVQEAAPTRLKGVHLINVNPLTQRVVSVVKPFVKKEIYELIKFHPTSLESFYNAVPKDCLPEDYEGLLPPTEGMMEKNLQNILDHWDFLKWHDAQRIDENKRVKRERGFFSFFRK